MTTPFVSDDIQWHFNQDPFSADKYKQIVPSKFLAIANFIERNFQQATGRDLVDSLRNVARVMKP